MTIGLAPGLFPQVSSNGGHMWVTTFAPDANVTLISIATGLVDGAPIHIGGNPTLLAWDGGQYMYVVNQSGNNVVPVNIATRTVAAPIAVGASPTGIAWDGAGHMYVCNSGGTSVDRIAIASRTVDLVIPVGAIPNQIIWDGAGHMILTINNQIQRIDIATGIADVAVGPTPASNGLAIDNAGYIWEGRGGPDTITRFNIAAWPGPVATSGINNNPPGIAFDGTSQMYYTDQGGNSVHRADVTTATQNLTTAVGAGPNGVAWDRKNHMYVCNTGGTTVNRILVATGAVDGPAITIGTSPVAAAWDGMI
jgi:YVTN family beta-propeller protein